MPVGNHPPRLGKLLPAKGAGLRQTFTFRYSDPDGYADITDAYVMINSGYTNGANTCWLHYNRADNSIRLSYDNTPSTLAWQPALILGSRSAQRNSQCSIDVAAATAKGSGDQLAVTLPVTFSSTWRGVKNVYVFVRDKGGATAGYAAVGTWTVPSR
ncbi:MAG TPA: hypothetical protein VN442_25350 [Bryobacteraceae bacterium]|nr:hypothetical protein [Bryobacteraceae bacterium]